MKQAFLDRMQIMLADEFDAYLQTLEEPAFRGVRANLLKVEIDTFQEEFSYAKEKTPFCECSFYISNDIKSLGNHPYHLSGLCYLQEPSASSAVEVLNVQQGDWVLDVCAAPGGKSTQIAAYLQNTGFLVSNEIDHARAQILLSNLERMGVYENMITNTNPQVLCEEMQGHFDKVLVDAPCSGEGMLKKNSQAMNAWSKEHVSACKLRQLHILESAYLALKQEGVLVYSTCTYAMEENEEVIFEFLKKHSDLELLDCGVSFGRPGIPYKTLDVSKVRRIFPMDKGEGHFIAKLKKKAYQAVSTLSYEKVTDALSCVETFLEDQLLKIPPYLYQKEEQIYLKQTPFIKLMKSKILRQGILCGTIRKERIEPHHHFYMSAQLLFQHKVEIEEEQVRLFYSGNVLPISDVKGYCAICYQGHVLGFGKGDGNVIKNKLPKGIRCMISKDLF